LITEVRQEGTGAHRCPASGGWQHLAQACYPRPWRISESAGPEIQGQPAQTKISAGRAAGGPHAGKFSVKYKDDPNWWTHSLLREGYGKDKHWVLLGLPSRDSP